MPSASRICASTKWPIRHFAMTGMVTASMIERISSGSDMRATPPSLRMSAGTRSRAITAHAPASCAMRACSAVTTSMMTPPFSIWASPALTLKDPFTEPFPLRAPLRSATFGILRRGSGTSVDPGALKPAGAGTRWLWDYPKGARAGTRVSQRSGCLEPLQDQRALGGVLAVGEDAVSVEPGEHVHLLEHVEQRGHGPPRQVGLGGGAGILAARVELADEKERFHRGERDPELANRAVRLLGVQMQHDAVAMPFERAVEVAAQHLAVEEPDRDLSGRGLGGELLVARKLHPLDGGQRDPGRLVVLQATGVVDFDQEVGFVEIKIPSHPFQGFVVEKAHDYLHVTPTLLTLMPPHSCARAAFRCGGRISCTPRGACGQLRPEFAEACRPGTGPAAVPPRRD